MHGDDGLARARAAEHARRAGVVFRDDAFLQRMEEHAPLVERPREDIAQVFRALDKMKGRRVFCGLLALLLCPLRLPISRAALHDPDEHERVVLLFDDGRERVTDRREPRARIHLLPVRAVGRAEELEQELRHALLVGLRELRIGV